MNKPQQFNSPDDPTLIKLRTEGAVRYTSDIYADCVDELFEIENPALKPDHPAWNESREAFRNKWLSPETVENNSAWIYLPWNQTLTHMPSQEVFRRLRTSRNRNLITETEQRTLLQKRIGIAGMSVGSNILNVMNLTGLGGSFKIADMDTISVPNLNRLMAPFSAVGEKKTQYFARKNYEVDPFIDVECYDNGLDEQLLIPFVAEPRLDLLVEEMDNPKIKVEIRKKAREMGIPVIMAADNGDGVLIDVERYDLDGDTPLFNGRIKSYDLDSFSDSMSFPDKLMVIAEMAGLREATVRMQDSIMQVGREINTWPQLGTAAVIAGVAVTFIARKILLNEELPSGRYHLTLEESFIPSYLSKEQIDFRNDHTEKIMNAFDSFRETFPSAN